VIPVTLDRSSRPRALFVSGSLGAARQLHRIGQELSDFDCRYTAFYADGVAGWLHERDLLRWRAVGPRRPILRHLAGLGATLDPAGVEGEYDLVVTSADVVVPTNLRGTPMVLVQDGMPGPRNLAFRLVRRFGLPRWVASASTVGLSAAYHRFCVASPGYRQFFSANGAPRERIVVTGMPGYDDCRSHLGNWFPYDGYVLVVPSPRRESHQWDDGQEFFDWVEDLAAARPLLFKLHPEHDVERLTPEIARRFPEASIAADGNTEHMIANCQALITQYSPAIFVGLALGKECHSYFDESELRRLLPVQNGGRSAAHIAEVCREVVGVATAPPLEPAVAA
jgi:hypothetical protein